MTSTRSSSRIKARQGKTFEGTDASLTTATATVARGAQRADSADSSSSAATPSKSTKASAFADKRRKTSHTSSHTETKKPTKRASKKKPLTLEAVTDLPLDILYEIFKHLRPADLLHLCHANKALRYTLLRPGSKGTWEFSFKVASNPRIPPCLDGGLSFPQYADLIYGKSCWVCGSTKDVRTLFMFLDKRCEKCVFDRYRTIADGGRSAPFDLETGYPGKKLYWNSDVFDFHKSTYLVDQDEYAKAEADVTALGQGPVDELKKYTDDLKAKAKHAADFSADLCRVLRIESYVVEAAKKKQIEDLRTQRREL
ncbi:uncharacterized protein SCHCODRAFT_02377060 [Schizophyllum commune H4-8]|uniref:uncharacterized protein n=1 Tax=Schizophyllum commune (strain H4-8 / FGSC 9210) TaxID=578458 RepID=UPI00215EBB6B|nr:uncharacterized protein SCHCODRAFT_02377060 [Schizophyllum commune H4-8]KAI5889759.1 hypothetical protein SCHCODRAFT_02377060 [Schizophyllum commune H4-8]